MDQDLSTSESLVTHPSLTAVMGPNKTGPGDQGVHSDQHLGYRVTEEGWGRLWGLPVGTTDPGSELCSHSEYAPTWWELHSGEVPRVQDGGGGILTALNFILMSRGRILGWGSPGNSEVLENLLV